MVPWLAAATLVVGLAAAEHICSGPSCAADEDETTLLALRARKTRAASQGMQCPGSAEGVECYGDQCCPRVSQAGNVSFPCSNAAANFTGCESGAKHIFDYVTCIVNIHGGGDCTGCQGEQCDSCHSDRLRCCLKAKCQHDDESEHSACLENEKAACCAAENIPDGMCSLKGPSHSKLVTSSWARWLIFGNFGSMAILGRILSITDCHDAAWAYLGQENAYLENSPIYPPGCYVEEYYGVEKMYFNTHPYGSSHPDAARVFKDSEYIYDGYYDYAYSTFSEQSEAPPSGKKKRHHTASAEARPSRRKKRHHTASTEAPTTEVGTPAR